jgi:hypothetical protein
MPRHQSPFKLVVPFLAGIVAAAFVKPLLRATAKTTVGVALRARKLAAETVEELQDIAAEASAEAMAAKNASRPVGQAPAPESR